MKLTPSRICWFSYSELPVLSKQWKQKVVRSQSILEWKEWKNLFSSLHLISGLLRNKTQKFLLEPLKHSLKLQNSQWKLSFISGFEWKNWNFMFFEFNHPIVFICFCFTSFLEILKAYFVSLNAFLLNSKVMFNFSQCDFNLKWTMKRSLSNTK